MMMRKPFRCLTALLLGTAFVAGQAPAPAAAQDDPIAGEIRFSWWGGQSRNEKTDRILQLFEEEYPDVTVVRENSDWMPHWDKLTIQSAGGNQPCTIQMQTRWLATYAKPNILRPLDDLYEAGKLDTRGIAESVIESSRGDDGQLYMIPSGVFFFGMMYNRTMAEEAGMPVPETWTWSEFRDYLEALAPKLPDGVNPTHNMGREANTFVAWIQSNGYEVFDQGEIGFPVEVVVDWFNYWEDMRKAGLTDSAEVMVADLGSLIEESNIANGRTFITERPPNRLDSHQVVLDAVKPGQELGIATYPTGEDGTTGMDLGANGIAIGATCPEELLPASVAWINFFTQDDRAAQIYESDNGVVAIDRFMEAQKNAEDTSRGQREQIEVFQRVVPDAKPVSWPSGGYAALTEAINRGYDAVAFELMTPEEAAEQFMTELADMLG
ncbi:ABC transporter substrate-binding protein [Halovulum marinum]|nr:extracellular solute-binding protein [Halovulum marinum]